MANIIKRRFIKQLPQIHQTTTLKNFFSVTVDKLFQPGSSEPISGYVGQKPSYYDPSKDFYIPEKTAIRQSYQLEPAMVSVNTAGDMSHSLCYDDLINYLRSQGAKTENHSRLFENDYYSWAPPVDLDKLNNPRQYVWMGGLSDDEDRLTTLVLRAPRHIDGYAGVDVFPLPPVNPAFAGKYEHPVVLVNGLPVRANFSSSEATVLSPLQNGDRVETIRYGDLTLIFNGQEQVDMTYFLQWKNESSGLDSNLTYQTNLPTEYMVGDIVWERKDAISPYTMWRCVVQHTATAAFDPQFWTSNITLGKMATTGLAVRLEDGIGPVSKHAPNWKAETLYARNDRVRYGGTYYVATSSHTSDALFDPAFWNEVGPVSRKFFVDGVGSSIELTPDHSRDSGGRVPHYVVIDRRSNEDSPWARRNMWVHIDTLSWTGLSYNDRQAQRPIIEFLPDIELFNYGSRRLETVNATLSTEKAKIRDNFDSYPYDIMPWQEEEIEVSRINGQPIGYLSFYKKNVDGSYTTNPPTKERRGPFGCIEVDAFMPTHTWAPRQAYPVGSRIIVGNSFYEAIEANVSTNDFNADLLDGKWEVVPGYLVKPGDRLLVKQQTTTEPELNNLIYRVVANLDVQMPLGEADVLELVAEQPPERGDIVRVIRDGNDSVFADFDEYWFDGEKWLLAQMGDKPPLFMLYDADQNQLSDDSIYLGTDFKGSQLFSYKEGTGKVDPILGFPLSYNKYAQPIFEVDPILQRVTFEGGEVGGYYYHHFVVPGEVGRFSNNWFPVTTPSSQEKIDGVYQIPLNLQANPDNEEVTYISRNEWFDHFSNIMEQQVGFVGHPYTNNNWRDTPKELGNGNKILQHRSPLLKTMLLSSDAMLDLLASIRYVDQEYTRYRNKFVQKLNEFQRNGTMTDHNTPEEWVQAAIESLRLNKTSEFPFVLSATAGGQFFIPPTPATLGIGVCAEPEIVGGIIRCHDASEVPLFGDFKDQIMLAFEQRVYDNIPQQFKTENRPVFDMAKYVEGYWYKNEAQAYTRDEMNAIMSPMFERWAQQNKLDYRTNTNYAPGDPFTWNYSTCVDSNGNPVAGNYCGIFLYYYDTHRPNTAPWEMLGFDTKPSWWELEYGNAPYTSGNVRMWEDLRDGFIRQGSRAGIDERYARPDLMDIIPVDDGGNLVDPVVLNLVQNSPTYQDATAPWKFGDGGPIEMLWRKSPSYPFALAQAAFLMKPARFVEECWDTLNVAQDASGQWIYLPTGNRPQNSMLTVHGEFMSDGARYYGSGVQQWISDHMLSKGQSPTIFGNAVRGLDVRLAHKLGGFTAADNIRVLADNFGIVPSEDIMIEMYRSPSIKESVYSGVLIEWTGKGWRVIGYDVRSPEFKIIPGMETGPKGSISLSDVPTPTIFEWSPNIYYATKVRVRNKNTIYESIKPHTSSTTFEEKYWKALGPQPPAAPRVTTYLIKEDYVETVPYGTMFYTQQEVANFLLGYERYLIQEGWVFENTEMDEGEAINDWSAATKEFLAWSQVSWEIGSFITLSPFAEKARFDSKHGMVLDILDPINGAYGITNRAGYPVDRRDIVVNRIDGQAELATKTGDLYGVRVHIGEIEHALFFSNQTIFGDLIYNPLFDLRQPRLRIIGNRSTDWTGRLDAPGYVIIDGQIKSNFEKSSDDIRYMFDIEKADNTVLRDHARQTIGYVSKSYFQSLVLSETEQFEFYQGMIKQKGAPGAFNKLMRSDYIEQSRDLRFFEEWAIKVDEYGAIGGTSRASFLLGNSALRNDPQMIQFRNTGEPTTNAEWLELIDIGTSIDKKWVERPKNPMVTFPQHDTFNNIDEALPMSGYVRTNEVDEIIWDETGFANLYAEGKVGVGKKVWVHALNTVTVLNDAPVWTLVPRDDPHKPQPETNIAEGWLNADGSPLSIEPYLFKQEDGTTAFRSKKCESPFVATKWIERPSRVIYEAEFRVRKIERETNGNAAILRPSFDVYDMDGNPLPFPNNNPITREGFGYDPANTWFDTTDWEVGRWYTLSIKWTPKEDYGRMRERIRINRDGTQTTVSNNFKSAGLSNAVFEMEAPVVSMQQTQDWQVFQVFNASVDGKPNYITSIETSRENPALEDHITRIYLAKNHTLGSDFVGKTFFINGSTQTTTDMEGPRIVFGLGKNWIDVVADNNGGVDFVEMGIDGPAVTIPRPIRFMTQSLMDAHKKIKGVRDGDIVYLDGETPSDPWRVYRRKRTQLGLVYWEAVRRQPYRINARTITGALVYDLKTKITNDSISPEPLVLGHLNVISPANGIVVGRAEREIDWKLRYDPANYSDKGWGAAQVGKVWWDLSTVRFLETETDYVVFGQSNPYRFETEANYRAQHWGKIAPASKVDIYEWTRSELSPHEWMVEQTKDTTGTLVGTPYGFEPGEEIEDFATLPEDIPYVTRDEYNAELGKNQTVYYYWMRDVITVPQNIGRKLDISTVSRLIANPLVQGIEWMAPILPNALVVGGVGKSLDDIFSYGENEEIKRSGTVVQIEINENPNNDGQIHDEWLLLRPSDERSQPPEWLWEKMRDSLVGFDDSLSPVPAPPEIVIGEAPVTNGPVFEDSPYTLEGLENTPYYPNNNDDD